MDLTNNQDRPTGNFTPLPEFKKPKFYSSLDFWLAVSVASFIISIGYWVQSTTISRDSQAYPNTEFVVPSITHTPTPDPENYNTIYQ